MNLRFQARFQRLATLFVCVFSFPLFAAELAEEAQQRPPTPQAEPSLPRSPKVLLIGDTIAYGYTPRLRLTESDTKPKATS